MQSWGRSKPRRAKTSFSSTFLASVRSRTTSCFAPVRASGRCRRWGTTFWSRCVFLNPAAPRARKATPKADGCSSIMGAWSSTCFPLRRGTTTSWKTSGRRGECCSGSSRAGVEVTRLEARILRMTKTDGGSRPLPAPGKRCAGLVFEDPPVGVARPTQNLLGPKPERHFFGRRLAGVRGVRQVSADLQREVVADGPGGGFDGTSGAHRLADGDDRVRTFPHHGHHRRGCDIADEPVVERLAAMHRVVPLGQIALNLNELGSEQPQPAILKPP